MNQINPTLIPYDLAKDVWGKRQNELMQLIVDTLNGVDTAVAGKASAVSPALTGSPTAPTANAGTSSTAIATTAFVQTAVAQLVGASPTQLDTLNELAAALANDPNFASSINTMLAAKLTTPTGGAAGQVLTKTSSGFAWTTPAAGGGGGVPGTVTDNGDGTFDIAGSTVVDNGDGTFTI